MDEQPIKELVARRAGELGGRVNPRDVRIEFMETEVAPGCRIFRASWGAGQREDSLSGLVRDGEDPDTYPAQALGKIFRRWIETGGKLPEPAHAARVSAYLYDGSDRRTVILSEEDKAESVKRREWLPHVRLPTLIEVDGRPGVAFWWAGPEGLSEVRFYFDERGRIRTTEKSIQDFLRGEEAEPVS